MVTRLLPSGGLVQEGLLAHTMAELRRRLANRFGADQLDVRQ
jgi:hypothetical protein